jgi:hypothetical protein
MSRQAPNGNYGNYNSSRQEGRFNNINYNNYQNDRRGQHPRGKIFNMRPQIHHQNDM